MFMVPGLNEVLRLNGKARLSTAPELLETMAFNGKVPRADLWNPDKKLVKGEFPTLGQINAAWYGADADEIDTRIADEIKTKLY